MEPNAVDPLAPQLEEAQRTLEEVLDEACESRPLAQADTGELIRIEEMLAIASDAAKRAISIRRKRRHQRPSDGSAAVAAASAMTGLESASSGQHRVFTDDNGERWDVWAVYPKARGAPSSVLRGTFRHGWLCLESITQKRRLSPIPEGWEQLSDAELRALCEKADVVPPRGN